MADNVELQAREREGRGKNDARRLRAQGMTPAVLYGDGDGNAVLAVPTKVVDYTLQHYGDNALYDLSARRGHVRGGAPPAPARRRQRAARPEARRGRRKLHGPGRGRAARPRLGQARAR